MTATAPAPTEAQWQARVVDLARLRGWWVWHDNGTHGRNQAGLPDLVLIRERVIWVELKKERGRVRPEQQQVMDRLTAAGAEVHLWRPSSWPTVMETLGPRPAETVPVLRARLEAVAALHHESTLMPAEFLTGAARCVDRCSCGWQGQPRIPGTPAERCPTVRAARGDT